MESDIARLAVQSLLAILTIGSIVVCAPTAAAVSGSISLKTGKPIRAAITLHDVSTTRTQGQTPFDRQFSSASNGTFSLTGVPSGTYQICVDAPQENVLDPCTWSSTPQTVTVPASGAVSGLAISVTTGYMMRVHVNDPLSALPQTKGGVAGAALSIRVITRANRHVNFRFLGASALAADHYLLAPFDEPLILAVESSTLALSDSNNQRYNGDTLRMPVRIPAGGSIPALTVNVGSR